MCWRNPKNAEVAKVSLALVASNSILLFYFADLICPSARAGGPAARERRSAGIIQCARGAGRRLEAGWLLYIDFNWPASRRPYCTVHSAETLRSKLD